MLQQFSESSKQRLKGELTGKVREPFAVITSIENKRGQKLAEHGVALSDDEALTLCAAVKADTGDDIPPDLMRKICALMQEPPGETPRATPVPPELLGAGHGAPTSSSGHLEKMAEGEFCIFTAEPEGDVDLPGGGKRKPWTVSRLNEVVANHGPGGRIAQTRPDLELQNPVVIGHEEDSEFMRRTDTPAAAWVGPKLRMAGRRLMAPFRDMPDKVYGWVKDKLFPTRSAEFYPDYHGFGPTLRRVALLGGQIPAKKDLGDTVFFGENEPEFEIVTFQEAEPMTLGEMILAAMERLGMSREDIMAKIAAATDVSMEVVQSWLGNQFADLSDDLRAQIAGVLKGAGEEKPPLTEAADAASQEAAVKMTEPTKPTEKPPETPKPAVTAQPNGEPTAEAFAEMTNRLGVLEQQHTLQKDTIAKLREQNTETRTELDTARRERHKADVEAFCETLNRRGQATGARLAKIKDFLLKAEGVEKFAEGASAASEARALFGEILPRVESDGRTLMTADALVEGDAVSVARAEHKAYVKQTGSDLTFEQFAEANDIEVPAPEEKKPATK